MGSIITERQRTMIKDIRASIKYIREHEKMEQASLNAVLFRAGIENQGHFYSTMMSLIKKVGNKEAQDMVAEMKSALSSLGIRPSYLWRNSKVPQQQKAAAAEESAIGEQALMVLTSPPSSPAALAAGGGEEVEALNVCIKSLQRFSQVKRENIINSVSMFYGLGAY